MVSPSTRACMVVLGRFLFESLSCNDLLSGATYVHGRRASVPYCTRHVVSTVLLVYTCSKLVIRIQRLFVFKGKLRKVVCLMVAGRKQVSNRCGVSAHNECSVTHTLSSVSDSYIPQHIVEHNITRTEIVTADVLVFQVVCLRLLHPCKRLCAPQVSTKVFSAFLRSLNLLDHTSSGSSCNLSITSIYHCLLLLHFRTTR
jgi:hypothetical protein